MSGENKAGVTYMAHKVGDFFEVGLDDLLTIGLEDIHEGKNRLVCNSLGQVSRQQIFWRVNKINL